MYSVVKYLSDKCYKIHDSNSEDHSIHPFRFQGVSAVLITDLDAAEDVLRNEENIYKPYFPLTLSDDDLLLKCPPLYSNFDMYDCFSNHDARLKEHSFKTVRTICSNAVRFLLRDEFQKQGNDETIRLLATAITGLFANEIICRLGFGINENTSIRLCEEANKCCKALECMFEGQTGMKGWFEAFTFDGPHLTRMIRQKPLRNQRKIFETNLRTLVGFLYDKRLRESRLNESETNQKTPEKEELSDCVMKWLIDKFTATGPMTVNDPNYELMVKQLYAFCIETFVQIRILGSFALHLLSCNHEEHQNKVRKSMGSKTDVSQFTYQFIAENTVLDFIINETIRMTPPIGFAVRTFTETHTLQCKLRGTQYEMKPGSLAFISRLGLHMDKRYWYYDPKEFHPSRWDRPPADLGQIAKPKPNRLLPYDTSYAEDLHRLALKMLLATLLTQFEITKCNDSSLDRQGRPSSLLPGKRDLLIQIKKTCYSPQISL